MNGDRWPLRKGWGGVVAEIKREFRRARRRQEKQELVTLERECDDKHWTQEMLDRLMADEIGEDEYEDAIIAAIKGF